MPINSKNLARRLAGLFRQAPVLWTTVFLLTTRMPFMLLYYPGCFAFPDTESCINHYYGLQDTISRLCGSDCARPLDNHHPIIYTFLYGWTIDLGNLIGSQNVAVFLFLAPSDLAFMAFGANHRLGTPPRRSTLAIALLHAVSRIWDVEYAISERQFLFALHLGLDAVPAALGRKA